MNRCGVWGLLLLALWAGSAQGAALQAEVKELAGSASWHAGDKKWVELKKAMRLEAGAWVRTGEQSTVVLQLGDRAAITIRELSVVYLKTLADEQQAVGVQQGTTWNKVKPGANTRYTVFTPAAVAAVRGTSFFVDAVNAGDKPLKAVIGVWDGEVAVDATNPPANQPAPASTAVKKGQVVEVLFNQPPKAPLAMEQGRLREEQQFQEQLQGLGLAAILGGGAMLEAHQQLTNEAEQIIKADSAQRRGADQVRQKDFPALTRALARFHHDTGVVLGKGRRFTQGKATLMPLVENKGYDGQPIPKWQGPYINTDFRDPFGGDYVLYEEPGSGGKIVWLQSNGLDKQPRSDDDVRTRISPATLENEYQKLPK